VGVSDLLSSLDEICGHLKIQDKALRSLLKLGLPVRVINGRYYAHAGVVDEWLRWFLNPHVSKGPVEINVAEGNFTEFCPPAAKKS
jgi:hypothetical protein